MTAQDNHLTDSSPKAGGLVSAAHRPEQTWYPAGYPRIDWRTWLGIVATAIWILFLSAYLSAAVGWGDIFNLPIEKLGSFLEGSFAPLAFLWFVLAYYSQQQELSQNTEAIKMQFIEIRKSTEQAVIQAEAIRASELHARRESFLKVADSVKDQLGGILGLLYLSSQGVTGSGLVSADKLSSMWSDMGNDSAIFARQILQLSVSSTNVYVYKFMFGTPIRTRHSENFIFNFERLLSAAEACDSSGMIKDSLTGSAIGYVYDLVIETRQNIPAGFSYQVYDFDPDAREE